jgi:hypothetical protein
MTSPHSGRRVTLLLVVVISIVGGAVLAMSGTSGARLATAAAYNHCTRYNPTTTQDTLCYQIAYNPTGSIPDYYTSGWAVRANNQIELNVSSDWFLNYQATSLVIFGNVHGQSTSGIIGGSGETAKAHCSWYNVGPANYNECTTGWG